MIDELSIEAHVQALVKAELHVHLGGTLEPEQMFQFAHRNGVSLPYKTIADAKKAYKFRNLEEFLDLYNVGNTVLCTTQDFFELTWSYLLRCRDNNVLITEIYWGPRSFALRGVGPNIWGPGIERAFKLALEKYGIHASLIFGVNRLRSQDIAFECLKLVKPWIHLFSAVGLAGAEKGNPPSKFQKFYQHCRELGLRAVCHAGEEGPPEYIAQALDLLQVDRIDHGCAVAKSPQLMNQFKQNQICLTVCPISNVKLCVFDSLEEHNIKYLFDQGLNVTINSDDPSYFGGYINKNFIDSAKALGFTKKQLTQIANNSIRSSFVSDEIKERLLALNKRNIDKDPNIL